MDHNVLDEDAVLGGLNLPQREAAERDGPVLVLAGAGTGKTTMLTARIAHLVRSGANPNRVLAVTFTTKAAGELSERAKQMIAKAGYRRRHPFDPSPEIHAGTFHALSLKLLREKPSLVGLVEGFTVADENAARAQLISVLKADPSLGCFADGTAIADTLKDQASALLPKIASLKDEVLTPAAALERVRKDDDGRFDDMDHAVARVYGPYQTQLREEKLADFGDLLLWPTIGMLNDTSLRDRWRENWDHILVDEFQDTNTLQHTWLKLLADDGRNLCVVGDDDQAIYGFAGADVEYILAFEKSYPNASVVRLEDNYRCSGRILDAANAIIAENVERRAKTLRAAAEKGEPVELLRFASTWAEAQVAAKEAWKIVPNTAPTISDADEAQSMFILYRANWQSRMIEDAMIDADVSYRLHGDRGFYARAEILDALALLQLFLDGSDRDAFQRVINKPARGIGAVTLEKILSQVPDGEDLILGGAEIEGISSAAREGLQLIQNVIEEAREFARDDTANILIRMVTDTGYRDMWADSLEADADDRIKNLDQLFEAADGYEPAAFLERARVAREMIDDDAPVTLMTLHASKGAEADWVFLAGWEEEMFPSKRALEAEQEGHVSAIEDERRLAYVGVTRAKHRCMIGTLGCCRFVDVIPSTAADTREVTIPKPPSRKAQGFAEDIAMTLDVELPADLGLDGDVCAAFIDAHRDDFEASKVDIRRG